MAIDSDIRDQAYQFFIQEAPELLQVIEAELLTLRQERSTAKIHNVMRAAHSIKGGAASVGLETIKTLAHSLEDIFKGLHNEELKIDAEVESLLLQAYDCLRLPLMEQITTGQFSSDKAMAMAEPVFAKIEAQIGDFLKAATNLPSSVELGVDIALSIFEVDVAQGLDRLLQVLNQQHPSNTPHLDLGAELRAQAEVFAGIAELLNLPGFEAIAQTALAALTAHPDQVLEIAQLALADFQAGQQAVIAGDRIQGGVPSTALTELAIPSVAGTAIPSLDDVFGDFALNTEALSLDLTPAISVTPLVEGEAKHHASPVTGEGTAIPSLDDVFGSFSLTSEVNNSDLISLIPVASTVPAPAPSQELPTDLATTVNAQVSVQKIVQKPESTATSTAPTPQLSVRVDVERLERMNNLVGELAINRNGLSLQNEQLQKTVQELLRRFAKFQEMGHDLRALSDQMLVAPERHSSWTNGSKEGRENLFLSPLPHLPYLFLTRWRWIATENYTLCCKRRLKKSSNSKRELVMLYFLQDSQIKH